MSLIGQTRDSQETRHIQATELLEIVSDKDSKTPVTLRRIDFNASSKLDALTGDLRKSTVR